MLAVGCLQNEECPLYNACRNKKCINPCAEDNPCAPTANCKVIRHEPKCTCPDGYIGDPRTDCRPRKFHYDPENHLKEISIIVKEALNNKCISL